MIHCLIFDLDGTLLDSIGGITVALNKGFSMMGFPAVAPATVASGVGNGDLRLLTRILPGQPPEVLQEAIRLFRESYLQLEQFPLYPGITSVLKHYRGRKIAVATNKPAPLAEYSVEKAGIDRYIDVVAADTGDVPLKPAPDLLFSVLQKLKMKASEAVMIGDSGVDIMAGKAAGMLTCGVTYGIGSPEAVRAAGPDYLAGSAGELIKLIP